MHWKVLTFVLLMGLASSCGSSQEKVAEETEQHKPPVEGRIDETAPGVRQSLSASHEEEKVTADKVDHELRTTWRAPKSASVNAE